MGTEVEYKDHFVDQTNILYEVFADLTSKGMFVTFGLKFGADFLAYQDDPLICHAKYLV